MERTFCEKGDTLAGTRNARTWERQGDGIAMRAHDVFLCCIAATVLLAPGMSHAGDYKVLHTFNGDTDGAFPQGVIRDSAGNLYGTTSEGGNLSNRGTVFKLAPDGTETILYEFCPRGQCPDGGFPRAGVIEDNAGNLYGTTTGGGITDGGVVFKVAPNGTETVLYNFCRKADCSDGFDPTAPLIMDGAGNLYGTTMMGGTGYGVVFKLAPDGTETVLHAFAGGSSDGTYPASGLIADGAGNLYGTTPSGGLGSCGQPRLCGVIFKVTPDGTETVLYKFGGADGAVPLGGLVMDEAGNLYGTTSQGGIANEGVVYELGAAGQETVLYRFTGNGELCNKGCVPFGSLSRDGAGNLYGVTQYGGKSQSIWGVVFRLSPKGHMRRLHSFATVESPASGVIEDKAGNFYGTTESTVFRLSK